MSLTPTIARLTSRAVITVAGPDWRHFLQGLITQDVEALAPGGGRFAALLTPQGRLLFDLFVSGGDDDCLIDCAETQREALIERLLIYRLRAKVEIAPGDRAVWALWGIAAAPPGWTADPRLPGLGFRGYGAVVPAGVIETVEAAYETHRLSLGVPGSADWGSDTTYPIEANFDLLAGIDFNKGCYVGQETTSRMKRRGTLKSRMAPITFDGPAPAFGAELLAGDLRAGHVLSGEAGRAMAMLRLDRLGAERRTLADGRPWRPDLPSWMTVDENA